MVKIIQAVKGALIGPMSNPIIVISIVTHIPIVIEQDRWITDILKVPGYMIVNDLLFNVLVKPIWKMVRYYIDIAILC